MNLTDETLVFAGILVVMFFVLVVMWLFPSRDAKKTPGSEPADSDMLVPQSELAEPDTASADSDALVSDAMDPEGVVAELQPDPLADVDDALAETVSVEETQAVVESSEDTASEVSVEASVQEEIEEVAAAEDIVAASSLEEDEKGASEPQSAYLPEEGEIVVGPVDILISKCNSEGKITYSNPIFTKLSGYEKRELVRQTDTFLYHEDMPKIIDDKARERLRDGKMTHQFLKINTKSGEFFWMYANISPSMNEDGTLRQCIMTGSALNYAVKKDVESLYQAIREAGEEGAEEALKSFAVDRGYSLNSIDAMFEAMQKGA